MSQIVVGLIAAGIVLVAVAYLARPQGSPAGASSSAAGSSTPSVPIVACVALAPHVAAIVTGPVDCGAVRAALASRRPGPWRAAASPPADYVLGQQCWFDARAGARLEARQDRTSAGDAAAFALCGAFSP